MQNHVSQYLLEDASFYADSPAIEIEVLNDIVPCFYLLKGSAMQYIIQFRVIIFPLFLEEGKILNGFL